MMNHNLCANMKNPTQEPRGRGGTLCTPINPPPSLWAQSGRVSRSFAQSPEPQSSILRSLLRARTPNSQNYRGLSRLPACPLGSGNCSRMTCSGPRGPQDGPRRPQEAPKTAQEGPETPNDRSKTPKMGPRRPKRPPRRPKRLRRDLPREPQEAKIIDFP